MAAINAVVVLGNVRFRDIVLDPLLEIGRKAADRRDKRQCAFETPVPTEFFTCGRRGARDPTDNAERGGTFWFWGGTF